MCVNVHDSFIDIIHRNNARPTREETLNEKILYMSLDAMAPFAKQAIHFRKRCDNEMELARSQNMSSSALAALSACKAKADTFIWLSVRAMNALSERHLHLLAKCEPKNLVSTRSSLYVVVANMVSLVYGLAGYAKRVGNCDLIVLMEDARAFEILFTIERVAFPRYLGDLPECTKKTHDNEEILWSAFPDGRSWLIFIMENPGLNLAHALACLYNTLMEKQEVDAAFRIVKALRNRAKTCAALKKYLELLLSHDASLLFEGKSPSIVTKMRLQLSAFRVALLKHFGTCILTIDKAQLSRPAQREDNERLLATLKFFVDPVEGTFLRFMRTLQSPSARYDSWNVVMQRELLLLLTHFLSLQAPLCQVSWLYQSDDFVHTYVRFLYFNVLKLYNHRQINMGEIDHESKGAVRKRCRYFVNINH